MNRISIFILSAWITLSVVSCSSNQQPFEGISSKDTSIHQMTLAEMLTDDHKGIGDYTNVVLGHPLDKSMIAIGKPIFETKCLACHTLTDDKLVGPGWKGVTDRRTPEWIMNFITDPDIMIDKDPVAHKMFATSLVRMPNQQITGDEARGILEFMRMNDGKK